MTRDNLGRDIRRVAKRRNEKTGIDSAPGVLFTRIRKNCVVILEDDECEEVDEVDSDLIVATYGKHLEYDVNTHVMEKITRNADRQQKRATIMVNSGPLTFILLAAALVTTSFLYDLVFLLTPPSEARRGYTKS